MKIKRIVRKKDEDDILTVAIPDLLRKIACDEIISYYAYMAGAQNGYRYDPRNDQQPDTGIGLL